MFDRPEVEVPRGVEPTGTNGRTRHTLSDPLVGSGLVLWWFLSLDGKEHCFLVVTETIPVKRLVVRVRCPVPGPPRPESWHGSGSAGRPVGVGRYIGFAVVMAQVRRPVPFRTRKLRPGRGDGTALERVWESSTPPHSTSGFPSSVTLREPPFLVCLLVRVSRDAREAPNPQHPCIAWSVSVTVSNDVMRLTRYARAGSRESRYDGKRQKPDN